jgi:hypothetical protein
VTVGNSETYLATSVVGQAAVFAAYVSSLETGEGEGKADECSTAARKPCKKPTKKTTKTVAVAMTIWRNSIQNLRESRIVVTVSVGTCKLLVVEYLRGYVYVGLNRLRGERFRTYS